MPAKAGMFLTEDASCSEAPHKESPPSTMQEDYYFSEWGRPVAWL